MLDPLQIDRRIAAAGTVVVFAVVLLSGALVYWQVFRVDLANQDTNPRVLRAFDDPGRGKILDREGNILAESLPDGTRRYTDPSVAHAVGYLSARYGSQGAELAFNAELSGQAAGSWRGALEAELFRDNIRGLDVRLTLSPSLQRAAAQALGGRKGAVVALNPQTGEVLAMVSVPTYDPGALDSTGDALLADRNGPLLNRVAQGTYPPGSTFKTVTAIAAFEHGVRTPGEMVTCPGEITFDGFPVSCANVPQGVGTYPFADAYTYSVNAIFAQAGVDLGWARLLETARLLGFGRAPDFTLDAVGAQLTDENAALTAPLLASTAFGQGELLASPLNMALVAAAVANDGNLVRPILGHSVMDGSRTVRRLESSSSTRVFSAATARTMRVLMASVVEAGQANGLAVPGVQVGGKTGTAETGRGTSHAWFIGIAPVEKPVLAIAVIVEDGGQGGVVASPIAGAVFRAAFAK